MVVGKEFRVDSSREESTVIPYDTRVIWVAPSTTEWLALKP